MYVAVLCMYILQVCTSSAAFHSDMGRRRRLSGCTIFVVPS